MPLAAASLLKPASQASNPAGSRQVTASTGESHRKQTIKPKKRIVDRMKTTPAKQQEGLFLWTTLAQDCGQRSQEERRCRRPISFKVGTVAALAWVILYLNSTLLGCPRGLEAGPAGNHHAADGGGLQMLPRQLIRITYPTGKGANKRAA